MKNIEVDEQIYNYIASKTQHIGESASDILRRLLINDKEPVADSNLNDTLENYGTDLQTSSNSRIKNNSYSELVEFVIPADVNDVQENQQALQQEIEQQLTQNKVQDKPTRKPAKKATGKASEKSKVRKTSVRLTESSQLSVPDLSLSALLNCSEFSSLSLSISRFLVVLSVLYKENPDKFTLASAIKGKKRSYLSQNQQELANAGRTTKPRAIPESPYWVITNVNSGRKRVIISQLMKGMAYNESLIDEVCSAIAPSIDSQS